MTLFYLAQYWLNTGSIQSIGLAQLPGSIPLTIGKGKGILSQGMFEPTGSIELSHLFAGRKNPIQ